MCIVIFIKKLLVYIELALYSFNNYSTSLLLGVIKALYKGVYYCIPSAYYKQLGLYTYTIRVL
jgi:hypothetical protein